MKNFCLVFILLVVFSLLGCSAGGHAKKNYDNTCSITVSGGMATFGSLSGNSARDLSEKFNEKSRECCNGGFDIISQQYVPEDSKKHRSSEMYGTVKCK